MLNLMYFKYLKPAFAGFFIFSKIFFRNLAESNICFISLQPENGIKFFVLLPM